MASNRRIKFKDNKGFFYVVPFIPIGYIFETTNPDNPSKYYGGTWEQFGKGRVTVALDTAQTEFNAIGKIGGSKFTEKHCHNGITFGQGGAPYTTSFIAGNDKVLDLSWTWRQANYGETVHPTTKSFGTGDSGNLQPYIVVYRWRKIAY